MTQINNKMDIKILGLAKTKLKQLSAWLSDNAPKAKIEEVVEAAPAPPAPPAKPEAKAKGRKKAVKEEVPPTPAAPEKPKRTRKTKAQAAAEADMEASPASEMAPVYTRDTTVDDDIIRHVASRTQYSQGALKGYVTSYGIRTLGDALDKSVVPTAVKNVVREMIG